MHIQNCSIVPVNSEHAVKVVSFVCELGANFSVEKLKEVISHYESSSSLQNIFPKKTEGQSTSITFSPTGVDVSNSQETNQLVLERVGADGNVEYSLSLQNNVINFSLNKYSRWASISSEALAVLNQFIGFILPDPGISVFGLQYVDEFIVTGEINSFVPSMLFDADNKILPKKLIEHKGPWHNHLGWFDDDEKLLPNKVLHNLNINIIPQHEKLLVQIIGAHRLILSSPISNENQIKADMANRFTALHNQNKALLKKLLNANALKEIHLEN
jgi:uncharacterized protein (TIGR04255 family)